MSGIDPVFDGTYWHFTLTWSGASDDSGVTLYGIYKDGQLLTTTTASFLNVADIAPAEDYSFKVEACDAQALCSSSGPETLILGPPAPPAT
jgi:hypothetical protein